MPTPTGSTSWALSTFSTNSSINALLYGTKWASKSISFSFATLDSYFYTGYAENNLDFKALFTADKTAVRLALQSWSNVSGLSFVETTDNSTNVGDLRFGYSWLSSQNNSQAWAYTPGGSAYSGDVWFNSKGTSYTDAWSLGTYEYQTAIHEIGHALGLKHNFSSSYYNSTTVPTYLDSRSYTVMSYSAAVGDSTTWFSYEPTTPMILDIDAMQYLYGTNTTYNSSNTTYTFYSTINYHQTIWDSGGTDTIVYESSTGGTIDLRGGVTGGSVLGNSIYIVNSSGQNVSAVKNIWIATNAVIENATGGSGNDVIIGNGVANTLLGGSGADTITGLAGVDVMNGGEGADVYVITSATEHTAAEIYDTGTSGVDELRFTATTAGTLTLYAGDRGIDKVVIGTGTDTTAVTTGTTANKVSAAALPNSVSLEGNSGANTLTGSAYNDTLDGGAGVDTLVGGAGSDIYIVDITSAGALQDVVTEAAGAGFDCVILRGTSTNTTAVTLTLPANIDYMDISVTETSLLNMTGGTLAETLIGNAAVNVITGGGAKDTMNGKAGADVYVIALTADHPSAEIQDDGTDGATDEVRFTSTVASTLTLYAGDTGIENVVIGTGVAATAVTSGTTALNVNAALAPNGLHVYGNAGANTLTGTGYADHLFGNLGNDTILGGAGADFLYGGNGNDLLTGGAGSDGFVFDFTPNATSNKDTITDFSHDADLIWLRKTVFTALSGDAATFLSDAQIWSSAGAVSGHDADDRIVYNQSTGALYYDADGSGTGAAIQIAVLGTATVHPASLVYGDFAIF